jgi:hypothetical protein
MHWQAIPKHQRCRRMPQIVKALIPQAGSLQ